ncbi:MAG: hypothetical protein MRJ93_11245 [Nitrososphaeraceae archaeon]|nr:hypothetical protein [Nitrososphaeraceae archaeon]
MLAGVGKVQEKVFAETTKEKYSEIIESTGVITTKDGEKATYKGFVIGQSNEKGEMIFRGIKIYETDSTGKLEYLNNLVGLSLYIRSLDGIDGKFSGQVFDLK